MEISFQLMIAYDMFYYIKFTALFPPAPTNDSGVCEQRQCLLPDCAQTTLTALAKRQSGDLKWHLCHTLKQLGE